jgi:hypothetical protein
MDHDVDVAVVGGGLGGLTLAIGLLRAGVPVEVFEQAGDLREVGAGVALGANSIRLLGRLGVGAASAGNVPPDVQFRRWDDGTLIWSHPVGDWYRERMGGPFVSRVRAKPSRTPTCWPACSPAPGQLAIRTRSSPTSGCGAAGRDGCSTTRAKPGASTSSTAPLPPAVTRRCPGYRSA